MSWAEKGPPPTASAANGACPSSCVPSVDMADARRRMSAEPAQSASVDYRIAASLTVRQAFQPDKRADVRNELRASLNGAETAHSSCERQPAARVRLESLTYCRSAFPG